MFGSRHTSGVAAPCFRVAVLGLGVAALGQWTTGCGDLDGFNTSDGRLFEGIVVGGEGSTGECAEASTCSFIRRGIPVRTRLQLDFRPSLATQQPGSINLWVAGQPSAHALTVITPLAHDPLSQYDFPGGGRVRNYMFGLAQPLRIQAREYWPMVFLSLMEDGTAELRLVDPSGALFGLFMLERPRG